CTIRVAESVRANAAPLASSEARRTRVTGRFIWVSLADPLRSVAGPVSRPTAERSLNILVQVVQVSYGLKTAFRASAAAYVQSGTTEVGRARSRCRCRPRHRARASRRYRLDWSRAGCDTARRYWWCSPSRSPRLASVPRPNSPGAFRLESRGTTRARWRR